MLSTKEIKNVAQASHYFLQQDNYYTHEEGIAASEWWGKGVDRLALSGEVDKDRFNELLRGILPDGQQLGKMVDGMLKHRAGWDLTFSAPKSVSLLALVGGDQRLIVAHHAAVKSALSQVERGCSQARAKVGGDIVYQNTGNLVAGLFHHDLSRAADPQLHTHCAVFNVTERPDGKWRSQASQIGRYGCQTQAPVNGFIERVRHHKRFYGQLYRSELAYQVKQCGYDLKVDEKTGFFEIDGVSIDAIHHFSQRRLEIESYLEKNNLAGGKASSVATLKTRQQKPSIDRETLHQHWKEQLSELNVDLTSLMKEAKEKSSHEPPSLEHAPAASHVVQAINKAAADLSVFQTTFTLEELVTRAGNYAMKDAASVATLLDGVTLQTKCGELIPITDARGKSCFMDKSTLLTEKRLLAAVDNNLAKPVVTPSQLHHYFAQHREIQYSERHSLKTLFNQEGVMLWEGADNAQSLLALALKIAKTHDIPIHLVSPSLAGSRAFKDNLQQKPSTLWQQCKALWGDDSVHHSSIMQFLSKPEAIQKNAVVLVDKAHLLSTYQAAALLEVNGEHHNKVILLGESHTLLPQQTGMPFQQLKQHGVTSISSSIQEKMPTSQWQDHLIEIKDLNERGSKIAQDYASLNERERKNSWVLASQKTRVATLNQEIHQHLKQNGSLTKSIQTTILIPHHLSPHQQNLAASYQPGGFIRLNAHCQAATKGEYCKIINNDKAAQELLLEKQNGKKTIVKLNTLSSGDIEYFRQESREIAKGESIVFQRSIQSLDLIKGQRYTVMGLTKNRLKIQGSNGFAKILDLKKQSHRHFDYGYATMAHAIAHERPTALLAEVSSRALSANQRYFKHLSTQALSVSIYTDNASVLSQSLMTNSGDRTTASDTVAHSAEYKKNLHALIEVLGSHLPTKNGDHRVAIHAIEYALHHLSEREAGFTHKDILETAMKHSLGEVKQTMLNQVVSAAEKAGILLRGSREDGTLWTTLDAVNIERELLHLSTVDKESLPSIAVDAVINKHLSHSSLHPEQIAAVRTITQTKDRIIAVQGYAGTGKTTMLQLAQAICLDSQHSVLGLAPTHTAAHELISRGIPAQTIDSFLFDTGTKDNSKQVLFVDESSMISNNKMLELLKKVHLSDARAVLIGDHRQLPAIEAGKPQSLIQTTVTTPVLTKIQRQRDPDLKKAVRETIDYDFNAAFETLKDSMVEINQRSAALTQVKSDDAAHLARIETMVATFMSYSPEKKARTLLYTPGRDDRTLANTLVREGYKQEGLLVGKEVECTILVARDLTHAARSQARSFSKGDVLRFSKSQAVGINAHEYVTVMDINKEHRLLTLKKSDESQVYWQLPSLMKGSKSPIEVFQPERRSIQIGDTLRWSRSNKRCGTFSSAVSFVAAIDGNQITVTDSNQKKFTFNAHDPNFQHWEYGYATTGYGAQGQTKQTVLALLESYRINLINQKSFLVALTRAVDEFIIFTDDKKALLKGIESRTGMKHSSLEIIGEQVRRGAGKHPFNISPQDNARDSHPTYDRPTIQRLREQLNHDAARLAINLLGVPKSRSENQLRFSDEGSLVVTIKGSKQGMWFDFAKGFDSKAGGDMLTLVQLQKECSFREAINFGMSYMSQHQKTADSSLEFGSSIQNGKEVTQVDTGLTLTGEAGAKELVKKTELPQDVSNNKQVEVAARKIIQKDVEMEL